MSLTVRSTLKVQRIVQSWSSKCNRRMQSDSSPVRAGAGVAGAGSGSGDAEGLGQVRNNGWHYIYLSVLMAHDETICGADADCDLCVCLWLGASPRVHRRVCAVYRGVPCRAEGDV